MTGQVQYVAVRDQGSMRIRETVNANSGRRAEQQRLGLKIGTNEGRLLGGFLKLNDAESVNFHRVPNQVLYQAEPLPDCYHLHSTIVYVTRPR